MGLQELGLTLCDMGDGVENGHVLYNQLALLTELQKLELGWQSTASDKKSRTTLDLTLKGGLGKLRTLTKLRALDVRGLGSLSWTVEDVRWMGEHWKSLRRLRWTRTEDKGEKARIRELLWEEYPGITFS